MSDNPSRVSPVEGLSIERFQGKTTNREFTVTVGLTLETILQNNPNRTHWIMINESANAIRVSSDPTITSASGWLLVADGGLISMDWEEDGEGTTYAVYGISGVAGNTIRVREVIRT